MGKPIVPQRMAGGVTWGKLEWTSLTTWARSPYNEVFCNFPNWLGKSEASPDHPEHQLPLRTKGLGHWLPLFPLPSPCPIIVQLPSFPMSSTPTALTLVPLPTTSSWGCHLAVLLNAINQSGHNRLCPLSSSHYTGYLPHQPSSPRTHTHTLASQPVSLCLEGPSVSSLCCQPLPHTINPLEYYLFLKVLLGSRSHCQVEFISPSFLPPLCKLPTRQLQN